MTNISNTKPIYVAAADIHEWARACAQSVGADAGVAQHIATYLLEGDLLGFRTHGLLRLRYNLECLRDGRSRASGEPLVLKDRKAVASWDAQLLPGLYVLPKAIDAACDKAKSCGTGTIVIRRAQHVASLAAYLSLATDRGFMISMFASTPGQRAVAPFGSKQAVFSPNPFAIGVPTQTQPILLDMSLSMTAAGKVRQAIAEERPLPFAGLITPGGEYTNDATTFLADPPSVLASLGGKDLGYKGSGLTLFSELWTMALSNYGRRQGSEDGDANTVWLQVLDPSAFGDQEEFLTESQAQLDAILAATPIDANQPVRVPGSNAIALKKQQLAEGVSYTPAVWRQLEKCAVMCGVDLPEVISKP
ncbi:Malate/lactate/ureidoglycolate dehydrogenase, LDH2 family [Pseudidiomarina planktonica]|uniref:Malate/lactate/ureidoglycolate dehydrogenase, LDH2 family n=1 Tax=Pseudidiomarina planktonica TaxID=1323738 RepID=A0A1Y6G1S0_9GAMM|nr:Ldh family oxidoreductase [Pseudidiomarina planktonica]RUO63244.1 lactate dehydrogenase [Pseudidiomarina planktonica]SMQ80542.1 Malate/lactate/ureidoglycolate dehydrogenase, LDH2 family [Pseudidiomarina planktonica]